MIFIRHHCLGLHNYQMKYLCILHLSSQYLKVKAKKKARTERLFKALHNELHKPLLFRERLSARKIKDKRTEATIQTPKPKRKRSTAKTTGSHSEEAPKVQPPTKLKIEHLIWCGRHQQPVEQLTTKQDATVNSSHSKKIMKPIVPMCIVSQPVVTQQSPVVRTECHTNPLPNHVYVTAPPQLSTIQSSGSPSPMGRASPD